MLINLKNHYDQLYSENIRYIIDNGVQVDDHLSDPNDNRYGVTLLIRPPKEICQSIQLFLNDLKRVAPDQYYYRSSDLHITVMSIISCYSGFQLEQIEVDSYHEHIQKSIHESKPFNINLRGLRLQHQPLWCRGFMMMTP